MRDFPRTPKGKVGLHAYLQYAIVESAETLEKMMRSLGHIAQSYYDALAQRLTIGFSSGRTIVFYNVPTDAANGLASAPDRRAYFDAVIRGHYRWVEQIPVEAEAA